MIRIAALDDDFTILERIRKATDQFFADTGISYKLETYQNTKAFYQDLEEDVCYDIYLLDVELPDTNGLEVARQIRRYYCEPFLIYITNHTEYAIEAFEVNAFRYIPKKILEEQLPKAYALMSSKILDYDEHAIVVENGGRRERIEHKNIYYLKKDRKYVILVHRYGESRIRGTLQMVLEELDPEEFMYIDKGCVVSIRHVMSLKQQQVLMRNEQVLPVSRPRLRGVKMRISDYWRRGKW
ncbi:MAG: LytTR family DNA-binding domain-containing protein [Eubacteriales bacterium]|nr:LytTR family DNA-binding domain-containing protein [Eubacteriales bacterium]